MLMVISPAKTLDYETPPVTPTFTLPAHLAESKRLISRLRKLGPGDIAQLMSLSDKLAALNVARYGEWKPPFTPANAKQAVLAFNGDVYDGLAAGDFSEEDFAFAQAHLRILSGLYGVLRPLDLMQPYRLEMGTRLANERGDNLYDFWGQRVILWCRAAQGAESSRHHAGVRGLERQFRGLQDHQLSRQESARHDGAPCHSRTRHRGGGAQGI